ncbi:hypothetical protein AWV80_00840 [Cupriavidus sp. UYMU48A]|nr:hypothetical protein AWV80_00840 [Cupriavidus sp. UYMU48A]
MKRDDPAQDASAREASVLLMLGAVAPRALRKAHTDSAGPHARLFRLARLAARFESVREQREEAVQPHMVERNAGL